MLFRSGAGADRVSEGMRRSFGKAVGTAARVQPGQKVFSVWTHPQHVEKAKAALKRGIYKIPSPAKIVEEREATA